MDRRYDRHYVGVAASSMIVGEVANQHAVIIKAAQNVLIGVVAFFIALYLSTRRGDKTGQARRWDRVGEIPQIHHRIRCRIAGVQPFAGKRPLHGRCQG